MQQCFHQKIQQSIQNQQDIISKGRTNSFYRGRFGLSRLTTTEINPWRPKTTGFQYSLLNIKNMKHKKQILKTILLLLLPAFVVAQDYPAFPLENSTWTEQNAIFEDYPPQTWTSLFVTENDTLINDISYCNVYEYYLNPSTFDTIRKLYSSVRQDTTAKEVFIIRHYLDEEFERVLLSFNHAVGDTVLLDMRIKG